MMVIATQSVYQPMSEPLKQKPEWYCPHCRKPVAEPLQCRDCLALRCRDCGSALEQADDLGIG